MWGGLPPLSFLVVCFVWASVVWAGLEGVSRTEAAAGWPCAVVWGWLVVVLCGVGNTPAAAWCGGGCPWCVLVCVCGGGMLSGFWGSAPWLPDPSGLLICCWGLWVGVGGLVVNCIVDASILL